MRSEKVFKIEDVPFFVSQIKNWAKEFSTKIWLETNDIGHRYSNYDFIFAAGVVNELCCSYNKGFEKLQKFQLSIKDWSFGYLGYDLKNAIEALYSKNQDDLEFPDLYFFQPAKLILLKGNQAEFKYFNHVAHEIDQDFQKLINDDFYKKSSDLSFSSDIKIQMKIFKEEYYKRFSFLQEHIHRGDIYEVNFCQEFYSNNTSIDPYTTYERLNELSKAPFASFLHFRDFYVISASPERYLKRQGTKIVSQPMKGTAKRLSDRLEDQKLKDQLALDPKERAENIMIVDLVRNDLSKSAQKGSVSVEELCAVYTYKQVHQMLSTITSEVDKNINSVALLKDSFPMGSMTGAPKIAAMLLIEAVEESKRGTYSGALGYFMPSGDFDLSVLIRTILYNEKKQYVSFTVGSAITANAKADQEYEECLIKAKAMRHVLEK